MEYDVIPSSLFSESARERERSGFQRSRSFDGRQLEKELLDAIEDGDFDVVFSSEFDGGTISVAGQEKIIGWIRAGLGWIDAGTTGAGNPVQDLFPAGKMNGGFRSVGRDRFWGIPRMEKKHPLGSGMPRNLYISVRSAEHVAESALLSVQEGENRRAQTYITALY